MNKITKLISAVLAVSLSASVFSAASVKQPSQALDSIIAVIDTGVITKSQLNQQVKLARQQLESAHVQVPDTKVLKKQILQRMIDNELQIQLAKKQGIEISNEQLNQAVEKIAAQNHLSVADFRQAVIKQGLDYPQYRKSLHEQMLISQLQQNVIGPKVTITTQEVNQALQEIRNQKQTMPEFHLAGILISLPEAPTSQQIAMAREHANAILAQLKQGADFNTTAVAESAGNFALKGGDMGWKKAAELPPNISATLSASKTNDIVGPIQTTAGFYLMKLLEKREVPIKHIVMEAEVRNILIKVNESKTSDAAKAQIEKIRQDILDGKDFATLAKKYSQDTNTSSKGGNMGWVSADDVSPAVAAAISQLKPGFVSPPFFTTGGWQIVQMLDTKQVDNTQKFLSEQVRQMIYQRKFGQAMQTWLQQLRGETYVKIFSGAGA